MVKGTKTEISRMAPFEYRLSLAVKLLKVETQLRWWNIATLPVRGRATATANTTEIRTQDLTSHNAWHKPITHLDLPTF